MEFSPVVLESRLREQLIQAGYPPAAPVCVALSGGGDSTALLHALATSSLASRRLRALHIDHGLQHDSQRFSEACRSICRRLNVGLEVVKVDVRAAPGESLEEAARIARYAALASGLAEGECLLTAHHGDDQVETFLLQLLRGSGLAGLASMPQTRAFGNGLLVRPLLGWRRADLQNYLAETDCEFVADPQNDDIRFDRAYLRAAIMPLLERRWPALSTSVARSVAHVAAAERGLVALARSDLRAVRDTASTLAIERLHQFRRHRRRQILRVWIRERGWRAPSARQLDAFLRALESERPGSGAELALGGGALRRYGQRLFATEPLADIDASFEERLKLDASLSLPAGLGALEFSRGVAGQPGLCTVANGFTVRFRHGGERIRLGVGGSRRALKDVLREARIVPWMRPRLPLLFDGECLAGVANLWIAAEYRETGGAQLIWYDRPAIR